MADYTRYKVEPEDMPRRSRARRNKSNAKKKRKFLWLKVTALVVLLLAIILLGMAAGAIYALSRNLPSLESMQKNPTAVNTRIYDQHGVLIAELHGAENRTLVSSQQIPEVMKQATVAVEDQRFYEHHGVDFQSLFRAIVTDIRAGSTVQGGSTITEQYVKNAYVGNERTYTRKLREAVLAWQLEDRWSKDKILTEYLNTIFYGDNAYGVEAAAETYFHKHIGRVTLAQAALLAALPKAPTQFDPVVDPQGAKQRRDLVLQLMAQQGYITQADAQAAIAKPVHVFRRPLNKDNSLTAYFTSYVTNILTRRYGSRQTFEGGLKVYTSINLKWQKAAINIVKSTTGPLNFGFKPSAALVAIDPKTGYIRTMVGGLDYKKQQYNLASQARRQPGSAMKPFVLTTAMQQGMDPYSTFYNSTSPVIIPWSPPWVVSGDGPGGPESVAAATTISDNVVFAQLSMDVGPSNTVRTAHKMGITSPLLAVPSITLGTSGVSPLEMADAYATFASGGIHHPPQAILKVVLPDGRTDWKPKTSGKRVIEAGLASAVNKILETVAQPGGTGYATGSYFPYPRAGKTGTAEDNADAWYCGYTPQLAAAVWMGDMNKRTSMGSTFGGTYCAPMWAKFFASALSGSSHPGFPSLPWTYGSWQGKMQQASPSPSASGSPSPKPSATKTIKPTVKPTPKPTPTAPAPTTPATPTQTPTATPTGK
jgi:1A family penicillin-binding protein